MAELNVNPTRMEMKKLKVKLATARRGHKLLKDKRDEMMKQFLEIVRDVGELRKNVEEAVEKVNASFSIATATSSPQELEEALMLPISSGELFVDSKNVMNIGVPVYRYAGTEKGNVLNYGYAFTSGSLDEAVGEMSGMIPLMITLAEKEKTVQMLADEIEKTRRRVNALEYIMIPRYESGIKRIMMKLDENERGNTTRLMKVKDMMLEQQRAKNRTETEEAE